MLEMQKECSRTGDGQTRKLASRPKVFFVGHGSKRYGSISQVARILATRSALLEKLAEDGPFTQQIRSKESSVSPHQRGTFSITKQN